MIHTDSKNFIHFEDWTYRRTHRDPELGNLEMKAFCGDPVARDLVKREVANHTVSRRIPEALASYLEVAVEMLDSDNWTSEHESRLDEILIPYFWDEINPKLKEPIKNPD